MGDVCAFPNVSAMSGYRYGCRCDRCSTAMSDWNAGRSKTCKHDGCDAPHEWHRSYCAEHGPLFKARPRKLLRQGVCAVCGLPMAWYDSMLARCRPEIVEFYRRVCATCRAPWVNTITRHRLDTEWALRLVRTTACELCGERFAIGYNGRPAACIDHDHRCCERERTSCGRCVRGVICARCNTIVGAYEGVIGTIGIERVEAYLR